MSSAPEKSTRPKSRKKKKMTDIDKAVIEAMNYGRPRGTVYIDDTGEERTPERDFKDGGLVGNQSKLDKNNDGQISGADFKMMKNGGKVKAKGMAMGGKVKAKGMAMGGKVKAKGMAMGGKIKSKGYALGGSIKSKGAAMGGAGFGAARSSGKAIVTY